MSSLAFVSTEADILKTRILVWVPLPTFRGPTSHSKMSGLVIFPHPTCEVKESGDCECLHPISHMAFEKWEAGLKREFPFLKYLPQNTRFAPSHRLSRETTTISAQLHL